ncbi:MAG: hypothetical protein HYW07_05795 [Candidatus Latescibacteria bacterium]|nr:hypothetical protein [Candidatus Latescibacterota bacterium]
MKQLSEIRAVDLVREIRDAQAKALAKKTPAEIIAFFNRAGERAKRSRRSSKPVSPSPRRMASR